MKTLITLITILVSLTITSAVFADDSSNAPIKTVGVAGVPANVVKGNINAVNVDMPASLDQEVLALSMKEKGLDYLVVVGIEEKTENRTSKTGVAKKVGLFALSVLVSAVTRSATNLNHNQSSEGYVVKIVTTKINLYGADGKQIRSKTTTKEMEYSEIIPTEEVAVDSLKELLTQG